MNKYRALFMVCFVGAAAAIAAYAAESVGNPRPGFPHDTIIVHVMSDQSGPKGCDGGHSLFLRHTGDVIPADTKMLITMIDWVQVDNDGDGVFDEDPVDTVDNDLDGDIDEDPLEPGAVTTALDCDSYGDGVVKLQIRDTYPAKGEVSTQEWFMRLIGKPGQNFAFTSFANQTASCTLLEDPDGILNSGDETVSCDYATDGDWLELAQVNLRDMGCVKQVKLGGKGVQAGGKTPFCNITDGFEVDVDTSGDGVADLVDQFIFSVGCLDDPATELNESMYCLSNIIWDIDEDETTSRAKAQIFVSHSGSATVTGGKIK